MIGQTISHYKILEKLGEGGMGVVYKAEDTKLDRFVALKFLAPHAVGSDDDRGRFLHEAKAAAALNHPNICTIYEINESEGRSFISMEYVEGESLKAKIQSGPLKLDAAFDIAVEIAEGLGDAHDKGIVHRDIKPANIMVTPKGQAKITDFGLAKLSGQTRLTKTGATIGTVAYMSPEQIRGESLDGRSDIWSFGVMLYEMVTGRLPFGGDYEQAIVYSILNRAPEPITNLRDDVSTELQQVIDTSLKKNACDRYQQVEELLTELKTARENLKAGDGELPVQKQRPLPSIAVLPFVNMSADPENEYFSDGLAEELINALTKARDLRVIARTSSFSFKGRGVDIREIGKKLNVETVLEGSVRKAGNRLRITAQLVGVADASHLWSEKYDRDMEDIFAIQDEISMAIVDKVKVELLGTERQEVVKQYTENPEAYTLYLKGRYYFHKPIIPSLQKAVGYFQQAIDLDPCYAKAHAGLAGAYMFLGGVGPSHFLPPSESYPHARAAIKRAMELDDRLPEAHIMLGILRTGFEWDWDGAQRAFERALELNPNNADTHIWYAWHLWKIGNLDAAMNAAKKALALDPLAPLFQSSIGLIHYCARRNEQAIDQFKQVLELDPNCFHARLHLGDAYLTGGMYKDAKAAYRSAQELSGRHSYLYTRLCTLYAAWNRPKDAKKYLDEVTTISECEHVPPTYIGWAYLALEQHEEAFAWFDKAYKERDPALALPVFPWWDPVKSDPRYLELVSKIGLAT